LEIEVDALVGKKITPAQRDKFIKLRSAQGEKEFAEFVADMPELPTLKTIVKDEAGPKQDRKDQRRADQDGRVFEKAEG
jgi:hypothetical protein